MINGVRGALSVAILWVLGCSAPSAGTITGGVTFTDGSDAVGLKVTLVGPAGRRADTAAGGAYSFDKLPSGVYLVSIEAPDTKEKRQSFGLESDGSTAVDAPKLAFSPVGSLTGKVNNAMGPAVGATVFLSGSDRVAHTDGAGAYTFSDVPAGDYTLLARAAGQIAQSATAMVKIKRGKQDAMPLVLANDLSVTGKIAGTIALFNGTSPKDIKISVADVSVLTNDLGAFTLTLPPGEYDVQAELAGNFPRQSLGFVTVRAGMTTTLPVKTLSIYKPVVWGSRVASTGWTATSEGDLAVLQVTVNTDYSYESYFFDTKTFERKLFAIGAIYGQTLSKTGKWVAFIPGNGRGVIAVNSATGQSYSFAAPYVDDGPVISNDEATMMFYAGAPQNSLVRVDLNTGIATNFPAFSNSFFQTNERFLARSATTAPFDVQLITPTSVTTVFNNMQALMGSVPVTLSSGTSGSLVAWVYNCSAACSVQVLGPTAANSSQVNGSITAPPGVISGAVKDWLPLSWGGVTPGKVLVKVADGSSTNLPPTTTQVLFNETLARVVTYSTGGVGYEVREDVVPPNPNSTVHFSSPTSPVGAWLSATRFMAFGTGTDKRVDIKNGTATRDPDILFDNGAPQSPYLFPPGALWIKQSTMKRVAAVYDSADLNPDTLGITGSSNFSGVGTRSSVANSVLGKFAGFSDGVSLFVLDGDKSEVRKVGVGAVGNNTGTFVPTDRLKVVRVGGIELQFFASGKLVSLSEPGVVVANANIVSLPKGTTVTAAVMASEPKNVIFFNAVP